MSNKLIALSLLLILFCSMTFSMAWANSEQLSIHTSKQIQRAYQLQVQNKLPKAIAILEKVDANRPYDRAYLSRVLGILYWQSEQPARAIEQLTQAIESNLLDEKISQESTKMLADILLTTGHYAQAESRYQRLLTKSKSKKDLQQLWLRIAQAQYMQQSWLAVEHSIKNLQKQQQQATTASKVSTLQMLLTAQLAQKKWQSAITTSKKLRALDAHNYLWWQQLSSLYLYQEKHAQALLTLQQADRAGFTLSDQQLTLMAQLYGQSGMPYQAANTYKRLSKLGQTPALLAQQATYWQLAKEWQQAKQSWQKAAALAPKYHWQLAQLNMHLQEFANAIQAIDKLSEKNAAALLTQARALHAIGKEKDALNVAMKAHQLDATDETRRWINYLAK